MFHRHNSMKTPSSPGLLAVFIALACVSCKDDPKLVAQRDKQKAEIAQLKGELTVLEGKLKNLPPDVTKDLEEAKDVANELAREVKELEDEVAELDREMRASQGKLDAYKAKYPAN